MILSKGFLKCDIFTIHRNFPSLSISTSFQSSKYISFIWAELQLRPFYLYIFIIQSLFRLSLPIAISYSNKSQYLCKICVFTLIMQTIDPVVVYCMQISMYNFTGEAHVTPGYFAMVSSFFKIL